MCDSENIETSQVNTLRPVKKKKTKFLEDISEKLVYCLFPYTLHRLAHKHLISNIVTVVFEIPIQRSLLNSPTKRV